MKTYKPINIQGTQVLLSAVSFKLATEQDDACGELRVVVLCRSQPSKTGVCK